jgi:hypothetical protein
LPKSQFPLCSLEIPWHHWFLPSKDESWLAHVLSRIFPLSWDRMLAWCLKTSIPTIAGVGNPPPGQTLN